MKGALERNYWDALTDASVRGCGSQVSQLEALLMKSIATINVTPKLLYCIAADAKYVTYYKAIDLGVRRIAERKYHAHRGVVDAAIHTGYETEIINAALSPDGRGLINYGPVTLQLQQVVIEHRASVLRENSFSFYKRHELGELDAEEAPGWRSNWAGRARLGVAHLAAEISPADSRSELEAKILLSGENRQSDRYMEVHIYGDLPRQAFAAISLDEPLEDAQHQEDWDFGSTKLLQHGIDVINFGQNAMVCNRYAEKLSKLGRFDEALAAYEQAIARFPADAVLQSARAETLRQLGRLDEALAAYEQAIARFPADAVLQNARAETLRQLGRLDEALAAFEDTIQRWTSGAMSGAPDGRTEPPSAASLPDDGPLDDDLIADQIDARNGATSLAHLCGPLGQALAIINGETWIYEGKSRRPAVSNDIRFFFEYGFEVRSITRWSDGMTEANLLSALDTEARRYQALQSLLMGMDPELSDSLRWRCMERAEGLLADRTITDFVEGRFSASIRQEGWDLDGARRLARQRGLSTVASLYTIAGAPTLDTIDATLRRAA
jgi:tetratricopeptide (TPR) repeat protein